MADSRSGVRRARGRARGSWSASVAHRPFDLAVKRRFRRTSASSEQHVQARPEDEAAVLRKHP